MVKHFERTHSHDELGRFIVPVLIKSDVIPLGEPRTSAVKRFEMLERLLRAKSQFEQYSKVVHEYFEQGHVELVPPVDLKKAPRKHFTISCMP